MVNWPYNELRIRFYSIMVFGIIRNTNEPEMMAAQYLWICKTLYRLLLNIGVLFYQKHYFVTIRCQVVYRKFSPHPLLIIQHRTCN